MNTCCHFPTYVDETFALSRLFRRVCLFFLVLSPQIAHAAGFLHAHGQDVVDDAGQKIILRGVSLGNWLLPEGYMWRFGNTADRPRRIEKLISDSIGPVAAAQFWKSYRQTYITEADIKRIAELGFNSVRPALNARLFMSEDKDAHFLDEGFELLDNLVRWCKASGIYVIIDMHAAPGGQTGQNIDDSADDQPLLFAEPKNQERLIRLWVEIASRYKDEPTVAAYDLLNEPLPERTGAAAKYKDQLEPLYRRVTEAIRKVDKRHMITLEGYDWANNWSVFTSRFDDNLLYQFHYYCWDNPTELKSIERYLNHRKWLSAPVWVGETGERDNAIYWATTEYFEANNIGWSFWPWKKMLATNCPYTVSAPDGWDAIVAPTRNRDAKPPDKAQAQKVFDQLLQNIRLQNCVYHPGVVNALFHRVPGRIEAENYSRQGAGKSFQLNPPIKSADRYRKSEPVPIVATDEVASRRSPGQGIQLSAGEWTSYDVNSLESRAYDIVIKIKADRPAELRLSINDNRPDPAQTISTSNDSWQELKLDKMKLEKGANRLKLSVTSGTASIDWLRFD